ncbi:MAG: tetratricopeptide repeat protein [Caldilineaceae bacterium]|nr:tetratricopeptide repeat protein [Caldilineaceae bacterium]
MSTLQLSLLGAFRLRLDKTQITSFYSTKVQALLAYLAVESHRPHTRAALSALLWPESPQVDANRSLRQALFQLNRIVDNPRTGVIVASRQAVEFRVGNQAWLDIGEFRSCLETGQLERAVDLYRGSFLEGFSVGDAADFESWARAVGDRLHRQIIDALDQLCQRASDRGDYVGMQEYALRSLAHAPWRERSHCALMLALAQQGQRSAALAQYVRCRHILEEELGAPPAPETVELYERIRNGNLSQPGRAAEIRQSPAAPRTSSPFVPLTPLVGRESQLTRILAHLADPHCRLLTLVGLGGVGKTRLALEAVKDLSQSADGARLFPDGIWFAPLLEANTTYGAVGVVAQTLGIPLYGDRTIEDQVLAYLRNKTLLLVLDNIEHLPGAAQPISALLDAAPGVKVLVTAQEALNLWDEWFFPIKGLAEPSPDVTDPDVLASSPAVALFALNARRRHPDFGLADEMENVARICRLVAGMPLAIELAASWLTRLSCAQIAERIAADLDFLSTAAARIPERHRSIRAVLDMTWDLLSAEEQGALRRLSIFSGSFHPQAAQKVADAPLSSLSRLLEKTLLQEAAERYQMHDLVRRYAEEKLLARPQEQEETLNRHSDFYLDFIAARQEGLFQSSRKEIMVEVAQEFENILSAWRWAADHRRFAQIDQAQESLFALCLNRGRYGEGAACFARLVGAVEGAPSAQPSDAEIEPIFGRALARQGFFAVSGGDMEAGLDRLRQALSIARRHGRPADMGFCLTFLGEFEGWLGNFDSARQLLTESIGINERIGDRLGGGFALYRLGELTHSVGDFEQARHIFQQCVAISRQIGSQDALGYALDQLGYCHVLVGDLAGAQAAYQESLARFTEMGNELGMALAAAGLGITAWARGEPDLTAAVEWVAKSIARSRKVGHPVHLITSLSVIGLIHNELADFAQAGPFLEEGLALARQVGFRRGLITCLNGLAEVNWQGGRIAEAEALLDESLRLAEQSGLPPLRAEVMVYQAALLMAESQGIPVPFQQPMLAQAQALLTQVLHEMPIQFIFRRRAQEMLATLAADPSILRQISRNRSA